MNPAACLLFGTLLAAPTAAAGLDGPRLHPLDPRGLVHIPIGIANTVDALKTFVEAEGNFSPGFGSYGIYFWVWDEQARRLYAPTQEDVPCEHGLGAGGALIPWAQWSAGSVAVQTEVCQVRRLAPRQVAYGRASVEQAEVFIVGARVHLTNRTAALKEVSLFVGLRPLGPAGGPVRRMDTDNRGRAIYVAGHTALLANQSAQAAGVSARDDIAEQVLQGKLPEGEHPLARTASSPAGDCSGALRFDLTLAPGEGRTLGFVCPVLAGRRVVGHHWDGVSQWAQFDLNQPNPAEGGILQADPGFGYWETVQADDLFGEAEAYWSDLLGRVTMRLPDPRWAEAFAAILGHSTLCLNEGAPDVAVINYNVFNRDGVYMASIFHKSANFELAEAAIDYFLGQPFNGRVQPEADNPGQILWVLGEHWLFTRDRRWLERVYPAARQLAALIRYYRTSPGPHWVWDTSLEFGEALPKDRRKELKPGACDGYHPEYTEAFDIAGLEGAVRLAEARGETADAAAWRQLAEELFTRYDQRFGAHLPKSYGSYAVLWPCRLYPLAEGKAWEQFRDKGAQQPSGWRYFPLAAAHQGLLAGNRTAGWRTLQLHLDHPQMRGWYAFDEGGRSGTGGWNHVRTTWKQGKDSVAMPHGWAIAEFQLLLRDCLVFEDGDRLVLLGGVPEEWFTHPQGLHIDRLPTHFGRLSLTHLPRPGGATLTLTGAEPPGGFRLRLPAAWQVTASSAGRPLPRAANGDVLIPTRAGQVELSFAGSK